MPQTTHININGVREKVSVSATEILAGVVLNQCSSNVLRDRESRPRAGLGRTKSSQKEIFSIYLALSFELEISRIRINRVDQLSQSSLPT
jgi:hypothetical protein